MPSIVFQSPDGTQHKVPVEQGSSVMHAATAHDIAGIVAECGGNAACATCHVYIDPEQMDIVGPPNEVEDEMLDFTAAERRPNSRLSCQIKVTDAMAK